MILPDPEDYVNSEPDPIAARLQLWRHIYGDMAGRIALFSCVRNGASCESPHTMSYVWPEQVEAASAWLDKEATAGRDVYMCAHLLTDRKRVKANAAPLLALYVDGDGAQVPDDLPAPTAVVQSSPGREQYYWRLSRAVDPQRGEELNRRLAYAMGADRSGWDLTQLLRPPATPNRKYPEAPAVTLRYLDDGAAYDPDELERILPPAPPRHAGIAGASDEPPVRLAGAALEWWAGTRQAGDRSGTLYAIGKDLYRAGATASTIAAALADRDATIHASHPDGPKYAGRPDAAARYLETAQKAAAAVEAEPAPAVTAFDQPEACGADPDCWRRVAELDQRVAALEDENRQLRGRIERVERRQRQTAAVRANPHLKTAGASALAVVFQYESAASRGALTEDEYMRTSRAAIAEAAGCSPGAVTRRLDCLERAGLIERRVIRETCDRDVDLETGEILRDGGPVSRLEIRLTHDPDTTLELLATINPGDARTWGGEREKRVTCPEHPNAAVKIYRVHECAECERELERQLVDRIAPDIRPDDEITPTDPRLDWRLKAQDATSNAPAQPARHRGVDTSLGGASCTFSPSRIVAAAGDD